MRISPKNLPGFSLLEVLLATFIFSIVMVGVTSYFVSIAAANQNTKRLQQNLEDIRFAMSRVAKVFRTSVVVSPTSSQDVAEIRVFDYSQSQCLRYAFEGSGMVEYSMTLPVGQPDEKPWCAGLNPAAFTSNTLVSVENGATLKGRFAVVPSDDGSGGTELAGRVTMNATVTRQNDASTVQTTVSLRNYQEAYRP